MRTSKEIKKRRQRLLRETRRALQSKVVAISHEDVIALGELRRALRLDRGGGGHGALVDLLGSILRALCFRETVRIGGVLYVRADELLEVP